MFSLKKKTCPSCKKRYRVKGGEIVVAHGTEEFSIEICVACARELDERED